MGGKTKTKTKVTPWGPAEGSIKGALAGLDSANATAQGTIAQWSPALNAAIGQIQSNIAHPPQYTTDARTQLDKTINGDYVNSNPYTEGMAKLIADKTQGGYNASFGASGRTHGGLAALLSGQGVGDALGTFYGNQYEGERGRQQQAIMASPAFHQDEYTDINQLFPAVQNTAMLPLNAANAYGSGVTNVSSPYNTTNTTQKKTMGLADIIGMAAQVGGAFMGVPPVGLMGGMGGIMQGGGTSAFMNSARNPFSALG